MKYRILFFIWSFILFSAPFKLTAKESISSSVQKQDKKEIQKNESSHNSAILNNSYVASGHFTTSNNHSYFEELYTDKLHASLLLISFFHSEDNISFKNYLSFNYPSHNFW